MKSTKLYLIVFWFLLSDIDSIEGLDERLMLLHEDKIGLPFLNTSKIHSYLFLIFSIILWIFQAHIPISPSYSDKRVRVEISGLNEQNQISVTRVGDDATLRCQAIVVDTSSPLYPTHGIRYGWEWRYTDEDPVSTSNIAVSLETNGDRLGLRGIRPPPGTKGRNVKGRCIVHVPAQQIDPSLSVSDELVYGSDFFSIDVAKKPTTIDPQLIPIPGRESGE